VGNKNLVGDGADESIASLGKGGRHPGVCGEGWKGRQDEQPACFEGRLEFRHQAHPDDASGGHPDDGLTIMKQDSEALPFPH